MRRAHHGSARLGAASSVLGIAALVAVLAHSPARADRTLVLPPESVWEGRYLCAQGWTALTLSVRPGPGESVTAIFAFGPTPEAPVLPRGSYSMRGVISPGSHTVVLVPDRWIQQPPGYVMVGMSGSFHVGAGTMQGRIDHATCGPFQLRRVR